MESVAVRRVRRVLWGGVLVGMVVPLSAGAQFSRTEFQYQGGSAWVQGDLSPPGFQHILTLQHASAWSHGENFFFVDLACCDDPVSNRDAYLEWYSNLSLGALRGDEISFGPVKDVMLTGGLNWGAQARLVKFTPGIKFSLDLPGFAFANLDCNYLVDFSGGLASGGGPKTDGIWNLDFNWARPFRIGEGSFSIEGHGEWQSPTDNEVGRQPYQVLLQPQVRYDIGKAMWGVDNKVLVGTELQVWINKFAVEGANEFLPQLLFVFGF